MQLFIFLIIPTIFLGMYAQAKVQGAYKKWSRVGSRSRITGREAAQYVMQKAGINDVEIVATRGHLTDHYDPSKKRLVLSEENYNGYSLAAVGVAAHEAGHAIQHATGYSMLQMRMSLVPITMFASQLLPFIIIGGFFFGMLGLIKLGVLVYLVLTIFQLVTLPVEFDASRRAKAELVATGILEHDEMTGVNKTLDAAALTYVAAFVSSLANLLYMLALARRD
jgi:Zn-dependent membrane protease YugP